MNGGMHHADFSPVGLLVVNGTQISPINLSNGRGNFFLKPSGARAILPSGPSVIDATEYPKHARSVRFATQSGPLLLKNGVLHLAPEKAARSRRIRNGVGVSGSTPVFVVSEKPVSLYELAVFFRDVLHRKYALYLDSVASSLHLKENGRS